ncbi:HAD family hydrolase [Singulisphaera sp. PoT]|uniref:HAD family hydrolase n=1 Tax=Singulisphaera sp. PoT TaxID=3411797 RepID=UPI003BF4FDD1
MWGTSEARAQEFAKDPLPSWQEGRARRSILDFVERVTREGGPDFVPPAERIATFDNDGTLWCEHPMYVQGFYVFDRVRALVAKDPSLGTNPVFKAIVDNDKAAIAKFRNQELAELLAATHSGMTTDEFRTTATAWLDSAQHPRFRRKFVECVYQPQLELLTYLRSRGFSTYMVTGGGIEFVRCVAEPLYGFPPERVIGSSSRMKFEPSGESFVLVKQPELGSFDDGPGKPININLHIGRRPILAFGNSDGDVPMLQYTGSGPGPRLMLLLHHDDAGREFAYDRQTKIGTLNIGLEEAGRRGWTVVSMKNDFKKVFPFDK